MRKTLLARALAGLVLAPAVSVAAAQSATSVPATPDGAADAQRGGAHEGTARRAAGVHQLDAHQRCTRGPRRTQALGALRILGRGGHGAREAHQAIADGERLAGAHHLGRANAHEDTRGSAGVLHEEALPPHPLRRYEGPEYDEPLAKRLRPLLGE